MKKGSGKIFCVTLLVTVMVFIGAAGESIAKDPIKIGFIGALSTPYGASNKASLEISIEELNAAGGILGRPVELITEDWKREVPLAVAAYKKLVLNDKCLLVFTEGTEGSTACAQTASRLYPSQPHLLFAFWTAHHGFTDLVADDYDKYKFVFRIYSMTGDTYNKELGFIDFFKNTIGTKKIALLVEDIGWTEVYRKGKAGQYPTQKEYFEQNGIEVVYYGTTDIKEKMFLPILEKVASSGADSIYWITGYTDTVTLVKQWAQSPAKNIDIVFQSGACSYAAFWKMTGGQALGVNALWPEIMIPFTDLSKPFLAKLQARGSGLLASTYGAYDGPWILKEALEKVGNANDVDALIKAIENGEFQRGFWIWAFDKQRHEPKKGYPYHPVLYGQFQEDGQYILVHPEELIEKTNPDKKFVRVEELRKRAGQ
ncbi:MAG: ABC transporter substrate-binding protein [Syntrophales bacterium]|jgi:branched-chain amino acid transport system substrate-binding protein|nr:ABC transporter substrate-binding protein [Syntrophales bacterium]